MKKLLSTIWLLSMPLIGGSCCGPKGCCGSNSNCCKPVVRPAKPKPVVIESQEIKNQQNNKKADTPKKQQGDLQKQTVKDAYAKIVQSGDSVSVIGVGGDEISRYLGYSKEELDALSDANLGLGCGNIVKLGEFHEGDIVLDLGSGAGLDSFLAAKKVGPSGMVIGVDMTPDMIKKARSNAVKYDVENVEFRLGDIENLPVASNSVDIIISNCVINLAPDKDKVFNEAHRVLKAGGRMYVTDTVLLGELSSEQKDDIKLLCACVAGALPREVYLQKLLKVGFEVSILDENNEISKEWFGKKLPVSSICYVATK